MTDYNYFGEAADLVRAQQAQQREENREYLKDIALSAAVGYGLNHMWNNRQGGRYQLDAPPPPEWPVPQALPEPVYHAPEQPRPAQEPQGDSQWYGHQAPPPQGYYAPRVEYYEVPQVQYQQPYYPPVHHDWWLITVRVLITLAILEVLYIFLTA